MNASFIISKLGKRSQRQAHLLTKVPLADEMENNVDDHQDSAASLELFVDSAARPTSDVAVVRRRSSVLSGRSQGSSSSRRRSSLQSIESDGDCDSCSDERTENFGCPPEVEGCCSSSAMSVESRCDIAQLSSAFAQAMPDYDDLTAEFNSKNNAVWVDFLSSDESNPREDMTSSSNYKDLRRLSWLGFDDCAAEEWDLEMSTGSLQASRRVQFDGSPAENAVHDHIARSDMTEHEIYSCWYDENDNETIQGGVIETLHMLQNGAAEGEPRCSGEEDGIVVCSRGLEHVVNDELLEAKEQNRRDLIDAVLAEQERQRSLDGEGRDPAAMAKISMAISKASKDLAAAKGEKDAVNAGMLTRLVRRQSLTPAAA